MPQQHPATATHSNNISRAPPTVEFSIRAVNESKLKRLCAEQTKPIEDSNIKQMFQTKYGSVYVWMFVELDFAYL